jgi:glucose/mannose-6-phosphate isomerase
MIMRVSASPNEIARYDRSGMLKLIEDFPRQCVEAQAIAKDFKAPKCLKRRFANVVFAGMGGSAIGADLLRSYTKDVIDIPIFVNRDYTLPHFVGKDSLVIASSYSGNTEETLSAYKDAVSRRSGVIALTSGGELKRLAGRDGVPCVDIPGGLPPRAALGYSFFPLLSILSEAGLIDERPRESSEAVEVMESLKDFKCGSGVADDKNLALKIAGRLSSKFPVIYGAEDHTDSVVTRWRSQLAENSKTISSGHLLPEMNHNEIVGWENPREAVKDMAVVLLRDSKEGPSLSKRMAVTKRMIESTGASVTEAHSVGEGLLARIFSLVYIGDFVSFYLAILNKVDPTPVVRIDELKRKLARG